MFGKSEGLKVAVSVGSFVASIIVKDVSIVGALVLCAGAAGMLYQGLTS
ncbi:hypothetical protein OEK23_003475 [Vibrio cholerae]|nr:hypothetical protein [Vibrio cholerae]